MARGRFGVVMTLDQLLLILLVGLVAGFLASHLVSGHGYGLLGDIVVGILGALVGSIILGSLIATVILIPLGISGASVLGETIVAFIGAVVLLAILRLVVRAGVGRGGRGYFGRRGRSYSGRWRRRHLEGQFGPTLTGAR